MEFLDPGTMQIILMVAIACGLAIGFAALVLRNRRRAGQGPDRDIAYERPSPASDPSAPRKRLPPDDRAAATAFVSELIATRRD